MLRVTRKTIRINRDATAWLIRRFIDPDAEFRFVTADEVQEVQYREDARGFDASGASYPHRDKRNRCSFEAPVDEYCPGDPAPHRARADLSRRRRDTRTRNISVRRALRESARAPRRCTVTIRKLLTAHRKHL